MRGVRNIVLIGGGGHAVCVLDLLERQAAAKSVLGYVDRARSGLELEYLGTDQAFIEEFHPRSTELSLLMAIGTETRVRTKLYSLFKSRGFSFGTLVDESAVISSTAQLGEGCVIFPNAVVGPAVALGDNVVIHSGAVVEHESVIGPHSFVCPGAVISGRCRIGEAAMIGAGATLIDNVSLADRCILAAGAVLNRDVTEPEQTLIGVPAGLRK